ncbi:MAG TPA: GGDEF domain-containing protein [Thermoleophilia bacterium]|nr:GGDEF domain-containing protein [Thermoleophilia bacterium]
MDDSAELLRRRLVRERLARKAAEAIIEEKSRELYIKNRELEAAVAAERRARRETEALHEALEAFTAKLDLGQIVRRLEGFLARLVPHQSRAIYVRLDDEFVLQGVTGRARGPAGDCAAGDVIARPPDCLADIEQATAPLILRPAPGSLEECAAALPIDGPIWMAVPMAAHDRHLGFLLLGSSDHGAFDETSARLAQALAIEAASALENVRLFMEVERLSATDPLTGLHNRRHFNALAGVEFERSVRYGLRLSAMMLDIDHFKRVNDASGHAAGDAVLVEVADTCVAMLRASDLDVRYGGEEFCFLLPETEAKDAAILAERIRRSIAGLRFAAGEFSVTVSIGIAERDGDLDALEALLRRSDAALYEAKSGGRDRVVVR